MSISTVIGFLGVPLLSAMLPPRRTGVVAVDPGVIAAGPGVVAAGPGVVAAIPSVVAANPGVVVAYPGVLASRSWHFCCRRCPHV